MSSNSVVIWAQSSNAHDVFLLPQIINFEVFLFNKTVCVILFYFVFLSLSLLLHVSLPWYQFRLNVA